MTKLHNATSLGRRWTIAATIATTAMVIGAASWAGISQASEGPGQDHGRSGHHRMHGDMTPEMSAKRIDKMVERMLSDGTPEQKAKVSAIAKAAASDLMPLRKQGREAHQQGMKLLSQPTIDRAALEKVRSTEVQLDDQRSKRMTTALADISEVLTPAQRVRIAAHFASHQARMGMGGMDHKRPMGDKQ
ncbi:Spy/CpxP family protein refolding chaperone [Actimicrobium antarcticum]|uniref:Periplasmic heavy metal sensor n=1 Tax=Actimicrobium antarcticum TaxID=1051899 RepID=A0ABP7T7B4_9BURK